MSEKPFVLIVNPDLNCDMHGLREKHVWKKNTIEVNGYLQLFGYQHSSKYPLLNRRKKLISFLGELSL